MSIDDSHPGLEVGMIGREGMVGLHLALGVGESPLQAIVQGAGWAWRAEAQAFGRQLARNPPLRARLGLYTHVQMTQLARGAACVRFHLISQRLARWLLMSADRARSNELPLTQEFLSYMLGVRRAGVTLAAGAFQKRGLIRYHRGTLTLTNRAGLVAEACSCYAKDRAGYAAVMG